MFQRHVAYTRFYYYFHFFFFAAHQTAAALALVSVGVFARSFLFLLISACRLDAFAKRVRIRMPQEPHEKLFVAYFFAPLAKIF